jgi:hypothetical protein
VGIRTALNWWRDEAEITAAIEGLTGIPSQPGGGLDPSTMPYASPWSSGELAQILAEDVFPNGIPTNTRTAAMRVPAIKRARGLICNKISEFPLRAAGEAGVLPPAEQPTWLYRTNVMGVGQRIVWTVDDLIFYGVSAWWRDNGADGFPLKVQRLNQGTWSINADMRVEVNGQVVPDDRVIIIPAYDEGILRLGVEALADTRALYEIVRDRLANPVPVTELHQVSGADLIRDEIDDLVDHWRLARRRTGGTVGFTNRHIEAKFHGADGDATLLIEARNAAAVDMARLVGISAGMLDATAPKASLNYETQAGRSLEFVDNDLTFYMNPITDRLSMDDCIPAGKRVVFDIADRLGPTPSATGPERQD